MGGPSPAQLPLLFLISLLCLATFFAILRLDSRPPAAAAAVVSDEVVIRAPAQPGFSILVGILTRADLYERRHFLRLVYGAQQSTSAAVDVKFVFCRLTKVEQRFLVALEALRFGDIVVLNCTENMNAGKTYSFLSALPAALAPRRYDYVMKTDDDALVRVEALAAALRPLPRRDLYYGRAVPCGADRADLLISGAYMSGMGFVLSWDVVEWIATSKVAAGDRVGSEDKVVGRWLAKGKKGRNRVSSPAMYDYPGTNGRCSHELSPETVVVHRLKRRDRWLDVIKFFNLTRGLKPSKLFYVDRP